MAKQEIKLIANNKKAHHDYFLEEKYEAGVELHGTEVKSLRMGKCSIKEAFVRIEKGEVIIYGMHISPYEKGNIFNKDPLRPKKLLMHKSEIRKLVGKIAEQGYTLVPVEVYFKGSLVKVQIALAKGKKLYDKRQDIAKKDMRREAERDFKIRNLGERETVCGFTEHPVWMHPAIRKYGLVMVSTGIMKLEKRVARDASNSTIKIKR